jgi:DNA-binding MarR family transcriptional regulator
LPRTVKTDESRSTIIIDLQGVTGLLTTVADRTFQSEISISQTHYALLLIISSLESPVSESDVAKKLHRGLNTISMLVDRMVKAGMIDRTRSTDDRRKCIVSLTISGKDKLEKGKRINETLSKQLLSVLDDKDVQDIQNLLSKLEAQAVKELSV